MTEHEYARLRPSDTLVVKFKRPAEAEEVREWAERFEAHYPDRRAVLLESTAEYRIEPRSTRTTHRLLLAAIATFLLDVTVRVAL